MKVIARRNKTTHAVRIKMLNTQTVSGINLAAKLQSTWPFSGDVELTLR